MSYRKTESAPASLVNSTIAMVPVLCGLLAYDQLARGLLSLSSFVVVAFCVHNILLCFFWKRLNSEFVKSLLLYLSVAFQWGYIATITAALWLGWKDDLWWANGVGLGICAAGLAIFSIKLGAEQIGSSAIFSVLGVVATTIWGWMAINESKTDMFAKSHSVKDTGTRSQERSLASRLSFQPITWSYQGDEGPQHWAALKTDYATCSSGRQQSPVDIPRKATFSSKSLQAKYEAENVKVVNNGHTLQVNFEGASDLEFEGTNYTLKQIHFHTPSEHTVSGLMYPMEVHFVHASSSGHLVVLGAFVEKGIEHAEYAKVFNLASGKVGEVASLEALSSKALLPVGNAAWSYQGSLTTPPCTEGVTWLVLRTPLELSEKQITAFRTLYPFNARPTQPLFDRSFEVKFPTLAH